MVGVVGAGTSGFDCASAACVRKAVTLFIIRELQGRQITGRTAWASDMTSCGVGPMKSLRKLVMASRFVHTTVKRRLLHSPASREIGVLPNTAWRKIRRLDAVNRSLLIPTPAHAREGYGCRRLSDALYHQTIAVVIR